MAAKSSYPTYLATSLARSRAGQPVGSRTAARVPASLKGASVRDSGKAPKPAGKVATMSAAKAIAGATSVKAPPVRLPVPKLRGGGALMSASRKGTPFQSTGGATAY